MDNKFREEDVIKLSIDSLARLTSHLICDQGQNVELKNVDDLIEHNLHTVRSSLKFKNLKIVDGDEFSWCIKDQRSKSRWQFVCTCLQLLKIIKNTLDKTNDEKVKLLSISEKKTIEISFQFLISLGLLPYLLPGVGISLASKCKHIENLKPECLKDFAKYRRLCLIMDNILNLNETDTFHEILASKYLEDILAALFQLSFAPIKKPVGNGSSDLENVDDDFEITQMTYSIWTKLDENKKKYSNHLLEIQKRTYPPLLIRKYLILLDIKKTPRWMVQSITKLLTNIIFQDNGIISLIRAIVEVDAESPLQWSHCDVVAKLISNTALDLDRDRLKLIVSQMLKILRYGRSHQYELVYIQVISLSVKFMLSRNPDLTKESLLNEISKPLEDIRYSVEDQITGSIEQFYNLCIVPTNSSAAVPIDIVKPVLSVLFQIYCKVKESVSHLKLPVRELLERFIQEAEQSNLNAVFDCLIFNETQEGIAIVPKKLKFMFSASGGICVIEEESEMELELQAPMLFLHLIKNMKNNERSVNSLFIHLLKKFVAINETKDGEKRLITALLLTELSQNESTLKQIVKNSENIIQFINDLLRLQDQNHDEIISVCLTFLTMVVYDLKKKKDVNWKPFDVLLHPLEKLKNSATPEVKLLSEEVYNLIRTRSVVGSNSDVSPNLIDEIETSACEEAFEEACDVLLPIRAHGLMTLISLLQKGDTETLAKIDKILCLFQENMKDKDSFLYLRAIEGLSTIALVKPEKILPILCQEFITCSDFESKLKIGEVLMRTVKLLKDFVPMFKLLLVNTFLNGVKSEDYLVKTSSLSNLGEVCVMLKYNIEDVIFEILDSARNVALCDTNPEARRGAVFLISSILQGLESHMFKVLESSLLELYKTLQKIRSSDIDCATRIHAQKSLDILNENMKQFFNVKPSFKKQIRVLDPF